MPFCTQKHHFLKNRRIVALIFMRWSDVDLKMMLFWGEKMHNRDQCNDRKTNSETACETPKIHENAQILLLELRTSGGARQLKPLAARP